MAMLTPAPGVLGGFSLLAAVELVCLINLIVCIVIVSMASAIVPVDFAGVRISGYMQCMNAAWFLVGIPFIIVGGVGAVFRVESQLRAYLYYLVGTLLVVIVWLGIFVRYGNACMTVQPSSGQYKKQALMVCQASNGMVIFWMLVLVGVVAGAIYLVWSMIQYVQSRLKTELLRYQEPWQAVSSLADDAAENAAYDRQYTAQNQHRIAAAALAPDGYFKDPLQVQQASNQDNMQGMGYGAGASAGGARRQQKWSPC